MAKIRIREIEAHLGAIQKIIDDCRADITAEKAAGEDGAGSGLGAKTLEESDQPVKQDTPEEFPGKPANPVTNGNMLVGAKDSELARRIRDNAPARDALDTRTPKGLRHIPYTAGVASLHTIPGFDRVK